VGALEAVETRTSTRQCGRDAWVGDADLQTFVDPIAQDGMVRRLAERSEAGARLRLLQQWLQAGVLDTDGPVRHPGTGTPQGGPVSPGLAKVCLHSVREVWGAQVVHQPWRGAACLLRDADDGVCACAAQAEAARVDTVLGHRLEQCGLELSAAQTRIIPVSRGRRAGKTSVAWLGCALRWGKDRQGNAHRKRRTARTKLRHALQRCTAWCKENRHLRLPALCTRRNATRRGESKDDGVHGHAASLQECFNSAMRIVLPWLNRRRQRHSDTWQGDNAVLECCTVARPRIVGRPKTRPATLKTAAALRQRVLLKSPVRENRTPGSVRGPSGNW